MQTLKQSLQLRAKFFRGLADRSRLAILKALREGPKNVSEIVSGTKLTQSNASMHLECLYCCGLVERERKGRFVYYTIRSRKTARLLEAAERAVDEVARHIEECSRYED